VVILEQRLLEQINGLVHIVDLVSTYVELSKAGKNYKGLCPFHQEKTPSFIVSPEKNIAKCMGCGEGGSPITFYKKIKGISLEQAAYELAEQVGLKLTEQKKADPFEPIYLMMKEANDFFKFNRSHTDAGKKATAYIESRGLNAETMLHFEIGLSPAYGNTLYKLLRDKGFDVNDMLSYGLVKQKEDGTYYDLMASRITFPIKNAEGFVVGFSGRTTSSEESVKYLNSPESQIFKKSHLLYHLHEGQMAIRQQKTMILHEGFFDVIASYQAGLNHSVATMGTALTKQHVALIKKYTDYVVIAYDGDQAGFEATNKAIKLLEDTSIKIDVAYFPNGLDPDDYLKKNGIVEYQSLFKNQLKDPYDYRYIHYKQKADMNLSKDRIVFKDRILKMIEKSDITIQSLYKKRLSLDLGIDFDEIKITSNHENLPFIGLEKPKKDMNKYLLAEIGIIIGMIQNKAFVDHIKKTLSHQHFSDNDMALIRYHLIHYYESHDTFDEFIFLDALKQEYKDVYDTYIKTDIDFKNKFIKDLDVMNTYIQTIKESIQKRRLLKLAQDRKQKPENASIYVSESIKIIKKLNGVNN